MKPFLTSRLIFALFLCWVQSASALQLIPVECVVELVINGNVTEQHSGACSYETPFVVAPTIRKTFRSGVVSESSQTAPEWIMKEVSPGFHATVYVGHNLSKENPITNLTVDYALVKLVDVRKVTAFIGKNKTVELEMPDTQENSSSVSSIFQKGEIKKVSGWSDGKDEYEIRIGIR